MRRSTGTLFACVPRGQVWAVDPRRLAPVEAPAPPTNDCAVVVALGGPMAEHTSSVVAGTHRASSSAHPAPQRPHAADSAGRDQQRDRQAASAAADGHLRPAAGSVRVIGEWTPQPEAAAGSRRHPGLRVPGAVERETARAAAEQTHDSSVPRAGIGNRGSRGRRRVPVGRAEVATGERHGDEPAEDGRGDGVLACGAVAPRACGARPGSGAGRRADARRGQPVGFQKSATGVDTLRLPQRCSTTSAFWGDTSRSWLLSLVWSTRDVGAVVVALPTTSCPAAPCTGDRIVVVGVPQMADRRDGVSRAARSESRTDREPHPRPVSSRTRR